MASSPYYRSSHWRSLRKAALERDNHTCVTPGCGACATHVDHIQTRPRDAAGPTEADVLSNLRSLCRTCDAKVKETASGARRNGGKLEVTGCGVDGRPLDKAHPWFKPKADRATAQAEQQSCAGGGGGQSLAAGRGVTGPGHRAHSEQKPEGGLRESQDRTMIQQGKLSVLDGGNADVDEPDWTLLLPGPVTITIPARGKRAEQQTQSDGVPIDWRDRAHREWLRITSALRDAGTLGPENRHQIERLVLSYVRYDFAASRVLSMGAVVRSKTGIAMLNQWQTEMRAADGDATTAEMELGITPRRRGSVTKAQGRKKQAVGAAAYLVARGGKP